MDITAIKKIIEEDNRLIITNFTKKLENNEWRK
jgi:hypothetical protein